MCLYSVRLLTVFWALWLGSGLVVSPALACSPQQEHLRRVDWKLFFYRLFAQEIRKELSEVSAADKVQEKWFEELLEHSHYTPLTFNQSIDRILEADTTLDAYRKREEVFRSQSSYAALMDRNLLEAIPVEVQKNPAVQSYLRTILGNLDRSISVSENFFESPEGINFMQAVTVQVGEKQDVILMMMPGYGAHTIKFSIFEEIVGDADAFYGRPRLRPMLDADGLDVTFEDHKTYYSRGNRPRRPFDILIPAGKEMGNTTGYNVEMADLMADWIRNLPSQYANSKIILLGYSKGAPTQFEMLLRHPDIRQRVIGNVTYAGVVQGTHVARKGIDEFDAYLSEHSVGDMIDGVRNKGLRRVLRGVSPFLQHLNLNAVEWERIKAAMAILEIDTADVDRQRDRLLDGRELREIRDGIWDLAPAVRTRWNLLHFDNDILPENSFVFSLSAVTDVKTFVRPNGFDQNNRRKGSLVAPTLLPNKDLNWKNFSIDAAFLFGASMDGFRMAPAGLYDTQVDLQHTKSPWLDSSPLSASLIPDELKLLWSLPEVRLRLKENGITTFSVFVNTPRKQLLRADRIDGFIAADLGEIRGHHWSLFHQAFRPDVDVSEDYAVWDFPRKAYMRALLQTIGLYNLIRATLVEGGS